MHACPARETVSRDSNLTFCQETIVRDLAQLVCLVGLTTLVYRILSYIIMAATKLADTRVFHEASLSDGGPDNYKNWYHNYEDYHHQHLHYKGPEYVVDTWQKLYKVAPGQKHKLFDAGCGTGLVMEKFLSEVDCSTFELVKYGGDYSEDMLSLAKKKNVYDDLKIVNLKEPLPYKEEEFDSILSSGVFLQGHCGPECIPNILRILKKGSYFITTVRTLFYNKTEDEWARQIETNGGKLIEVNPIPYMSVADGVVVVIQKQ